MTAAAEAVLGPTDGIAVALFVRTFSERSGGGGNDVRRPSITDPLGPVPTDADQLSAASLESCSFRGCAVAFECRIDGLEDG